LNLRPPPYQGGALPLSYGSKINILAIFLALVGIPWALSAVSGHNHQSKGAFDPTMSVYRLKDKPHGKPRKLPWRAVAPRQGETPLKKQFADRQEAIIWEAERRKEERLKDVPEFQRAQELKNLRQHTVRDLVFDYIKANPEMNTNDILSLNQFARENICSKSVLDFSKQDVHRWIEKKKNKTWKPPGAKGEGTPISPRTIRRQLNIVQRVFQYAIEYRDGFASLPNHFRGIRIQGSTGGRRERSLEGDELERILKACKACQIPNNYYVPLAIYLAIDTGMRRQEIFNLVWADIDENNRRIRIRKSKTDKATGNTEGTTIVLPAKAKALLLTLVTALIADAGPELLAEAGFKDEHDEWEFPQADDVRIFPMTEKAFTQSWSDALKRAGIENLHFHDLRREANTRFIKAGLTPEERNLMLRHADKSMNATYVGRNFLLNGIQDKLDRFVLGGLTLESEKIDFGEFTLPIKLSVS
jgi:integrase